MDTTEIAKSAISDAELAVTEADANADALNDLVAIIDDQYRQLCWDAELRANAAVDHATHALNDAKEMLGIEPYATDAAEYAKAVANAASAFTAAMRRSFTDIAGDTTKASHPPAEELDTP